MHRAVQTPSHAYWTWRLTRGRPGAGWRVLGAVTPDVPGFLLTAALRARGVAAEDLLDGVYRRPAWRSVHRALHSALGPLLAWRMASRSRGARAWAAGWAGHLLVDYGSHHSDAWPALWPLSAAAWRSPISYWEPAHHARAWSAMETGAIAVVVLRASRWERAVGLVVGVLAAAPLVAPRGQSMWEAGGLRP